MEIELQFNSVTIQAGEIKDTHPFMFSAIQPYLPTPKSPSRRRAKKRRETVASLIDPIIDSIDEGISD